MAGTNVDRMVMVVVWMKVVRADFQLEALPILEPEKWIMERVEPM